MNCDKANNGLKGGSIIESLEFLKDGLVEDYCYTGLNLKNEECPSDQKMARCERKKVTGFCLLEGEEDIKKEVFKNGPVIGVIFPYRDLILYKSGIMDLLEKSKIDGFIVVKIVGWDRDDEGASYWIVESLWGKQWGEDGLGKVYMGGEEMLLDKFAVTLYA